MPPRRISLSEIGHQNIVHSDAEQTLIKNALKTTKAGLLRLGTLRSNVPARRRQLKDQIRRCQIALAPFKKIPNEIWMYIFELYCQSGRLNARVARQPRVVITQVCSAWRQIALSMPKLWSDVHLGENVNLAMMWLGRAGNIPRSLETSKPPSNCCSSNRPQIIQTIISSFPFRKLHLTGCDAEGINFMRIPVESLLPLEDLALFKSASNCENRGVVSFSRHHFPNLVSLRIDTNMPLFNLSRPFATWKKLRVLRLRCRQSQSKRLEILLHDASSLEDCSLRLTSLFNQNSTIENPVVANLKILRLSFPRTSSLWTFLGHFTFPNLHTLILDIPRNFENFQPSHKSPLLRLTPRFWSLRSLNFHRFYANVDVGFVLECLPLLQVLELHCEKITTDTAEKIGRGELGGCLHELRDWNPSNLYELLQVCELRCDVTQGQSSNGLGVIPNLEKVSVRYSRHSKSETGCKRRIRKLRKRGVRFEVFQVPRKVRSRCR